MNNSVKLFLGVVGFALLLALLVPSGTPAPEPVAASLPTASTTPQILGLEPNLGAAKSVAPPIQVEYFKFGEPTIDGKPFGSIDDPKPIERPSDEMEPPVPANPAPLSETHNASSVPAAVDLAFPEN